MGLARAFPETWSFMNQVDVIVPCYQYGRYLEGCVRSILSQEGVDVRVLILDDASPDNTAEIGQALAARDGRVEYRRHQVNQKHIATYNEGLAWAKRDYTLLLSADDQLPPGSLWRATRLMDAHSEVGFTYGECLRFQGKESPPAPTAGGPKDAGWNISTGEEFFEELCSTGSNPVYTPTVVTRTRVQKEIGGYWQELPHAGDMAMWLHFAARGSVGRLDAVQGCARVHPRSMSKTMFATPLQDFRERQAAFDFVFARLGARTPDSARLQRLAKQALARDAFWSASRAFDQGDTNACRDLLAFATAAAPEIRAWPEWSRLRWKRRLGTWVWSAVRPLVERWRGRPAPLASPRP
jgi:glycosyltransferase involved in cell wall biosynthesis